MCRSTFHLLQNPNTNHLGTTVWDSSIVLAKYLEKVQILPAMLAQQSHLKCPWSSVRPKDWSKWHPINVQNAKKGEFARHRLKGKRAIELGSGMGLGGFAFGLLGCETVVTDTAEVLPLLQRNYENNLSPAALRGDCL